MTHSKRVSPKKQLTGQTKRMIRSLPPGEAQESLALLTVLALTNKNIEEGKTRLAAKAFKRIRERVKG